MPKKLKKFNKRKDEREGWMSDELLQLVNTKTDLYIDWKKNSKTLNIYNEKKYILGRLITLLIHK